MRITLYYYSHKFVGDYGFEPLNVVRSCVVHNYGCQDFVTTLPISPFLQLLEFIVSNSVEIIVFYHFEQLYIYFKRLLI